VCNVYVRVRVCVCVCVCVTDDEVLQPLRVCSRRDTAIASSYECEQGYSVCACKKSDIPAANASSGISVRVYMFVCVCMCVCVRACACLGECVC